MTDVAAPVEPRDCPYLGLDYYTEELGGWFFGREAESDKIISNLMGARLTLLHAESGVGKSSVLRAGVAWRLRQYARTTPRGAVMDLPVVFNYWKDDPVRDLIAEIAAAVGPFLPGGAAAGLRTERLDQAIEAASAAADAGLLVILDQFEEYFVYCSQKSAPERFADELARCINRPNLPANFLISIREDAYAGLGDLFKGRIANVYGNYLHIDYLDRESAEQAIRRPLEVYNQQPGIAEPVTISGDLVDAVLREVRVRNADGDLSVDQAQANGNPGRVATPLLQLVMQAIWQRELGHDSHELQLSTLHSLEGVGKIVDTHLEQALGTLDRRDQRTAVDMLDHLVTPSGTKIAESVPDLAQRTHQGEDRVGRIMAKLGEARIVRPVQAPPDKDPVRDRRYEILHDALVPAINHQVAARDVQRRTRRAWRFAALAVLLFLTASALVIGFALLWSNANKQKMIAESRQLAAAADANLARDPQLSALLAMRALRLHDTSQAEAALRDALPQIQAVRTFRTGTTASWAVFDPVDPNKVASAGKDGAAAIWDVKTGRRLVRLWPKSGFRVNGTADAVAFNATDTQVAVGYAHGTVVLFNARSGRQLRSINVGSTVNDLRYLDRISGLAIATQDGIRAWLPGTRRPYKLSFTPAYTIAVDPKGSLKFAVTTDKGTYIWNLNTGAQTRRHLGFGNADAEFSSNGKQVVTVDSNGFAHIYNLATFKETAFLDAGEGTAYTAAFSQNGKLVVAGYKSGVTRVWDVATQLLLTSLSGNASTVYTARFSPTGNEVVTASADGTVRVWQAMPRELRTAFATSWAAGTPNPVFAAQYSPDGRRILAVDTTSPARVFTASGTPVYSGGQPVVLDPGGGASVNTALFNRAGTEIVTANSDGTVDLWHARGSSYAQIRLPSPIRVKGGGPAHYAGFSPDGSRIAVVTDNDTAEVFSSRTGQLLQTLDPHHGFLLSVAAFSHDGRQILTGDNNGQVEVWNAATGHMTGVLGKPGPAVNDVEFNASGSQFVTATDGGVVTLWDARHDRQVRSISACPSPSTASFSSDERKIVVACGDGSAPVFDAATGELLTVLKGAEVGEVNSAAFSPDGKSIVTTWDGDGTGGVRIWSSDLVTTSLQTLENLAKHRITRTFTAAERKQYLTGISG
jgi:WD40 repeat protein